jgi:hypothetical protein
MIVLGAHLRAGGTAPYNVALELPSGSDVSPYTDAVAT